MKSLFTFLIIGFALSINAQVNWTEVMEADNPKGFYTHTLNKSINTCHEVKGSEYHLLSMAIKMDAKKIQSFILNHKDLDLSTLCADKTILMYAVKYGDVKTVESLIDKGAEIKQRSRKGRTALEYARKYEKREIYDYLKTL